MPWPGPAATDRPAPFGLGTAPLGGLYDAVAEDTAAATIRRGIDRGATVVDTAPYYGSGLAESHLGAVWRSLEPGARPLLSSKVGRVLVAGPDNSSGFSGAPPLHAEFDWSERGIRSSFESSLGRIGADRLDICLAHDADEHEEQVLSTGFPAMRRLQDEGLVTAVGAGMNQAEMLERFVVTVGIDVLLLAGRWTLLDHEPPARRLLARCLEGGVGVMLGGVLNSGLLAGGSTFNYQPAPADVVARRDALSARCREHGVALEHAAYRFSAGHPAVSAVLVGARTTSEVDAAVDCLDRPVPPELWDDLRRHGLLSDEVADPLPA